MLYSTLGEIGGLGDAMADVLSASGQQLKAAAEGLKAVGKEAWKKVDEVSKATPAKTSKPSSVSNPSQPSTVAPAASAVAPTPPTTPLYDGPLVTMTRPAGKLLLAIGAIGLAGALLMGKGKR